MESIKISTFVFRISSRLNSDYYRKSHKSFGLNNWEYYVYCVGGTELLNSPQSSDERSHRNINSLMQSVSSVLHNSEQHTHHHFIFLIFKGFDCLVFLSIKTFSLIEAYGRFRGTCCLHHHPLFSLMKFPPNHRFPSARIQRVTSLRTALFADTAVKPQSLFYHFFTLTLSTFTWRANEHCLGI
jgi:hypothetical protein